MIQRIRITAEGIVQGVGFRPFIYSLARRHELSGFVLNNPRGVWIEVEGEESALKAFSQGIQREAPPLARIERLEMERLPRVGFQDFEIRESRGDSERLVLISPDVSICPACLRELFDPKDRRYRYPFINCTHCGPRFTIIVDVPYDRDKTTMKIFPMCPDCRREYEDPSDRRFHAQPNACPICGPQMRLLDRSGAPVEGDPFQRAAEHLKAGGILAVKGLGGFHLACDARKEEAVAMLRTRKAREEKPLALMVPDLQAAQYIGFIGPEERELLLHPRRPIVLLRKRPDADIASGVAPHQHTFGAMLPYTPLHHLLLSEAQIPLVMTSGNLSKEPIAYRDEEAFERLRGIADGFLVHNRAIHMRCDDSVSRVFRGREMILRRSRGYVPQPITLPIRSDRHILACGPHLKNTFCLVRGQQAFVSHHIGDLENVETLRSFEEGIQHFQRLFAIQPEVVAYDLHPDYLATKYALALPDLLKIGVQHHHAHIVSCLADNGLNREVIGVAFDGTGYGTDGRIWGGEFLLADGANFERVAHLQYIPMPGGEAAIKAPWRMAASYLYRIFGERFLDLNLPFVRTLDRAAWELLRIALKRGINCPETSSIGRLFDAVSALLGIRPERIRYEGQAAIELENTVDETCEESYTLTIVEQEPNGPRIINPTGMIQEIVEDIEQGHPIPRLAARFHNAVARMVEDICVDIWDRTGLQEVALSGGVFQNMILLERTVQRLEQRGFTCYTHHQVPPNDGGMSLGQAMVAACQNVRRDGEVVGAHGRAPLSG